MFPNKRPPRSSAGIKDQRRKNSGHVAIRRMLDEQEDQRTASQGRAIAQAAVADFRRRQRLLQQNPTRGRSVGMPQDDEISVRHQGLQYAQAPHGRSNSLSEAIDERRRAYDAEIEKQEREQLRKEQHQGRAAIKEDYARELAKLRHFYDRDPELEEVFSRRDIDQDYNSLLERLREEKDASYANALPYEMLHQKQQKQRQGIEKKQISFLESLHRRKVEEEQEEAFRRLNQQHDQEFYPIIDREIDQALLRRMPLNAADVRRLSAEEANRRPSMTNFRDELRATIEGDGEALEFMTDPISHDAFWEQPGLDIKRVQEAGGPQYGYLPDTLRDLLEGTSSFRNPMTRGTVDINGRTTRNGINFPQVIRDQVSENLANFLQ